MAGYDLRCRLSPALEAQLRLRDQEVDRSGQWARKDSAGAVARRDLARYYDLLSRELAQLDLTEAEAALICDANNGIGSLSLALEEQGSSWLRSGLLANVSDSIELNALHQKHGLSRLEASDLLGRMQRWTPGQVLAVVDAVERFWGSQESTIRDVGLIPKGP